MAQVGQAPVARILREFCIELCEERVCKKLAATHAKHIKNMGQRPLSQNSGWTCLDSIERHCWTNFSEEASKWDGRRIIGIDKDKSTDDRIVFEYAPPNAKNEYFIRPQALETLEKMVTEQTFKFLEKQWIDKNKYSNEAGGPLQMINGYFLFIVKALLERSDIACETGVGNQNKFEVDITVSFDNNRLMLCEVKPEWNMQTLNNYHKDISKVDDYTSDKLENDESKDKAQKSPAWILRQMFSNFIITGARSGVIDSVYSSYCILRRDVNQYYLSPKIEYQSGQLITKYLFIMAMAYGLEPFEPGQIVKSVKEFEQEIESSNEAENMEKGKFIGAKKRKSSKKEDEKEKDESSNQNGNETKKESLHKLEIDFNKTKKHGTGLIGVYFGKIDGKPCVYKEFDRNELNIEEYYDNEISAYQLLKQLNLLGLNEMDSLSPNIIGKFKWHNEICCENKVLLFLETNDEYQSVFELFESYLKQLNGDDADGAAGAGNTDKSRMINEFNKVNDEIESRLLQLHSKTGILHNDLKYDNFLVNKKTYDVKIIDYSHSKMNATTPQFAREMALFEEMKQLQFEFLFN